MVNSPWRKKCTAPNQVTVCTFERFQWQKSSDVSAVYLIYKWCVAVQFVVVLFCSIFVDDRYGKTDNKYWKWLIFLTNWGYTMCTVQALVALWIIQLAWLKKRSLKDGRSEVPRLYRIYWALHSGASAVSLTVSSMYWLVVHRTESKPLDAIGVLVHAVNSILMVMDLCLVSHPCPLLHVFYSVSVGTSYTLFSYVYYECGGTNRSGEPYVYATMDWRKPWRAVRFAAISVAVCTAAHLVCWTIVKLRLLLWRRLNPTATEPPASPPIDDPLEKSALALTLSDIA